MFDVLEILVVIGEDIAMVVVGILEVVEVVGGDNVVVAGGILEVMEVVGGNNVVVVSGIPELVEVSCECNVIVEACVFEVLEVVGEDKTVVSIIRRLLFCVVMVIESCAVDNVVLVFAEEIQLVPENKDVIAVCAVKVVVGRTANKEEVVVTTTNKNSDLN